MFNAPELITQVSVVARPAHDVWSLGVTYFAMLTGSIPWKRAHKTDARYRCYAVRGVIECDAWESFTEATKSVSRGL